MYNNIKISDWRQFQDIDINFDEHLTILTGANGAGKTTILNILSKPFGRTINFVSTPEKDKKTGILKYLTGKFFRKNKDSNITGMQSAQSLGSISYNSSIYTITLPNNISNTYSINISNIPVVNGVFISSHRSSFVYKNVTHIPTRALSRKDIFSSYKDFSSKKELDVYYNPSEIAPTLLIKEALISLATFGYGNQVVEPNYEATKLFEGYQEILKKVLPPSLGFQSLKIEVPEVILETKSGNFSLDAVSGGIASIIELTWQIYMYDDPQNKFIVIMDEPENHLHPELQRTLLPNLIESFPNVQFIVATHNPFVISSVDTSQVYVLNYNDENKVVSYKLDQINKNGTANDILRDVLGIQSTIPIWANNKLQSIIHKYSSLEINSTNISKLRQELIDEGFDNIIPQIIIDVLEEGKNDDKNN